ncbi:kinase-like protein [Gigaspora margarita]|uniref:Kinase-like protein n=1 Tax=Gigaspora margarita TaxID=4874 RepID=A0A8H4A5C5_GIGMA|nr:kinase-like protein [Gigaspora margarita]
MSNYRDNVSEDSEDYKRVRELIDIDKTITSRESSDFLYSFWEEFRKLNISNNRLSRNERELSSSESKLPTDTNAGSSIRFELNAANVEVANITRLVGTSEISETEARIIERRKGANLKTIIEIEHSMNISLCYVLDCTASMSRHIAAAKDCILQVIEFFKSVNPCIKFRLGFCGYRDHCNSNSQLQIFNFTNSCEEFRTNVTTVKSTGGSDPPENVLGGLNAAITNMDKHFTTMKDDYPDGDPNGLTVENVLQEMQLKNIFYAFEKITKHTDTMIEVFRSIIGKFSIYKLIGDDPLELINKRIVIKKLLSDREDTFEKYLEVAEISAITTYLTIKFNSIAGRKNIPLVNFVRVHLVHAIINGRTRHYFTEPELQGAEFRRFNSNSGFIREYRPVLEAFSHSYISTQKNIWLLVIFKELNFLLVSSY